MVLFECLVHGFMGYPEHIGKGKQITGDMLEYIVGDNPGRICETDKLYPSEVAKEIAVGIIRK